MEITITELRRNTKKYFDMALNADPVVIERGGVHYELTAIMPTGTPRVSRRAEKAPGEVVAYKITEPTPIVGTYRKTPHAVGLPKVAIDARIPGAISTPIITEKNKTMEFCKHGAVKGLCKKGCK
jgi:hypothetical protein